MTESSEPFAAPLGATVRDCAAAGPIDDLGRPAAGSGRGEADDLGPPAATVRGSAFVPLAPMALFFDPPRSAPVPPHATAPQPDAAGPNWGLYAG